jgi:FkbM family methyltransferase
MVTEVENLSDNDVEGFTVSHALTGWRLIAWQVLAPVRAYLRSFPIPRGKGLLLRGLVLPSLPATGKFDVRVPGGPLVSFGYRERLGLGFLLRGGFENAEIRAAWNCTREGTLAIDVGANAGLFTAVLASRAGPAGRVAAVEPLAENVERIKAMAMRNSLTNVSAFCCAAGAESGSVLLHLAADSAFTSAQQPKEGGGSDVRPVEVRTIDSIWTEMGRPSVSFMKVDVEGMESEVLAGAVELLDSCGPALLLEANSPQQLARLTGLLVRRGYRHSQPAGFEVWNHLFLRGA